jgi:hypothetical protein
MTRFGIALLYAVGGYVVAAFAIQFLIGEFSSNTHDRSVEAAMTIVDAWVPLAHRSRLS